MRIGIVAPAVMYGEFQDYFDVDTKKILSRYANNNNVPAPSLIAKGLISEGHFVRLFTIGKENKIFHSQKIDIIICKKNKLFEVLCPLSELSKAFALYNAIKHNYKDLDILHSHWTYHTALSTVPFAKKIKTLCTVRDWTPTIISYLPNRKQKRDLIFNAILKKVPNSFRNIWIIHLLAKIASLIFASSPNFYWKSKLLINDYVFRQNKITFIANSLYTKYLIESKIKKTVPCIMNMIDDNCLFKNTKKTIANIVLSQFNLCLTGERISAP